MRISEGKLIRLCFRYARRLGKQFKKGNRIAEKGTSEIEQEERNDAETVQSRVEVLEDRLNAIERALEAEQLRTDAAFQEVLNAAMLPRLHPVRAKLSEELRPRMVVVTDLLGPVLFPNQVALDELDWMYKLPEKKFPYSATFEEGMIIKYIIEHYRLKSGFEIATAFGFSSFFAGIGFQQTGGRLISVDAYIEEELEDFLYSREQVQAHLAHLRELISQGAEDATPRGLAFAQAGRQALGLGAIIGYEIGSSPHDVPSILGDRKLDYAFIDGGHFGDQPLEDVNAVVPHLNLERFVMLFHDTMVVSVAQAVHAAAEITGGTITTIATRNRLVAVHCGVDTAGFDTCNAMTLRRV